MTDRTASAGRAVERSKSARRGGPSGRQAVGDYVGQPAGDAAQAVRRAGLRPGLDRSFGCAEELIGLVVAQEPTAGSSLARNGMVTLYVAAPGSEPIDEGTDAAQVESGGPEPAAVASVEAEQAEAASAPVRVRRRKRGRARRAAPVVDAPPAPVASRSRFGVRAAYGGARAAGGRAAVGVAAGAGRAGWRAARRRSARGARRGGGRGRGVRGACGGCAGRAQRPGEVARGVSAPSRAPRAGRWPRCSCMVARASPGGRRCRRGDPSVGDCRLRFCAGRPALAHPGCECDHARRPGGHEASDAGVEASACAQLEDAARGAAIRCPHRAATSCVSRPAAAPGSGSRQRDGRAARRASRRSARASSATGRGASAAAAPPASDPPAAAPEQTGGGLFSP